MMTIILQIQDSVNAVKYSMETMLPQSDSNLWMWISIFEAICIIVLLLILLGSQNKYTEIQRQFKANAQKEDVDFNNIIVSSFHAGDLYNQLKKVCHPDRFSSNPELMYKADNLFQQITQNKHDLKKLQELKAEAMKELHINI